MLYKDGAGRKGKPLFGRGGIFWLKRMLQDEGHSLGTRTGILTNTNSEAPAAPDGSRLQARHLHALKFQLVEQIGHKIEELLAPGLASEAAVAVILAEPLSG